MDLNKEEITVVETQVSGGIISKKTASLWRDWRSLEDLCVCLPVYGELHFT